ncbi:hypothetical protein [Vallitalea guaymasensis]|uniref:hypothetical protein n=1 Tax=Vallitalea guaymasensis TaxID=1185412 RepID=UPI000DE1B8C5|nr:hypothetical protein [Vallitalea guaymasensis]
MNLLKRFKIEFPGIKDIIYKYTKEGSIANFVKQMDSAIEDKDIELIKYLLDRINQWYEENQRSIQSNEFVYNKKEHIKSQKLLLNFAIDFKEYSFEKEDGDLELAYSTKKFFISHSSKDKKICKAFVVLLEELGVPESDILCHLL